MWEKKWCEKMWEKNKDSWKKSAVEKKVWVKKNLIKKLKKQNIITIIIIVSFTLKSNCL